MEKKLTPRAPVVVVLGHVDHGKTTLLDFIRKTNVAQKEAGLITQRIGAYEVKTSIKGYPTDTITFIDTPGHEAFKNIRMRGAHVADIAVLVVDSTDSVKPQTIESIFHIKSEKIPFVVAANKIDLPAANIERVKKDLAKQEVLVEGMGGSVPIIPISAKKGIGINDLLEAILYIAADSKLNYSIDSPIEAYVIEVQKTKAGVLVSCIIKNGHLKVGDEIWALDKKAKIKSLIDDQGKQLNEVFPSKPFVILGFKELLDVGVALAKSKQDIYTKEIDKSLQIVSQDKFFLSGEDKKQLRILIKTDSLGSKEAICEALSGYDNIFIEYAGVGVVNKSDIFLAKVSKAIIINFGLSVPFDILELAKQEKVLIKSYNIIYELLDEIFEVSKLLEEKGKIQRQLIGEAKIIATFRIDNKIIAGINVLSGKISINDKVECFRDGKSISEASVVSLRQKAKNVREVKKGEEAGLILEPELDFKVGDVIKSYSI